MARFNNFLGLNGDAAQTPESIALAAFGRQPLHMPGYAGTCRRFPEHGTTQAFSASEVAALAIPNGPELITALLGISRHRRRRAP